MSKDRSNQQKFLLQETEQGRDESLMSTPHDASNFQYLNPLPKSFETAVTIQPQAGYCCKTHIESRKKSNVQPNYPSGTVVYINICHSDKIPAPALATEAEIQEALAAAPGATYRIPLSLGLPRQLASDDDKKGVIMDASIHTQPFIRSEHDLDFRLHVLELAMEHIEDALSVNLSRRFTMLKLPAKGMPIPKRIIHLPKSPGSTDAYISNKIDESNSPMSSITELPSWSCSPSFSQENGILTVVLQMPLSHSPSAWKIEIDSSRILLKGVEKDKAIDIMLPVTIITSSSLNHANYYKKSRHIVVNLAISELRSRYL